MCLEKRGRTIHLLKQQSKPVPQNRKRRKIALATTPEEYIKNIPVAEDFAQKMQVDTVASEDKSDKATGPRRQRVKTVQN